MRMLVRAAVAGLCAVGVVASAIAYRSELRLKDSFTSVVDGRPPSETLRLLDGSETLNPDFRRDTGRAGFLVRLGQRRAAVAQLRAAAEREPDNARVWLESIPVWLELGRRDEAVRAYARAKRLDSQLPRTELPPAE